MEELFIPDQDHYEELKNKRGRKLVARKGVAISWEFAHQLGIVSTKHPPKEDEKRAAK